MNKAVQESSLCKLYISSKNTLLKELGLPWDKDEVPIGQQTGDKNVEIWDMFFFFSGQWGKSSV